MPMRLRTTGAALAALTLTAVTLAGCGSPGPAAARVRSTAPRSRNTAATPKASVAAATPNASIATATPNASVAAATPNASIATAIPNASVATARPSASAVAVSEQAGGTGYWTASRLLEARAWRADRLATAETPAARMVPGAARVGALFLHDASGNHFCTASVVASPGRDLLVTAAHCINGGPRGGARRDVVFIAGYRDGKAPFGIWSPARLVVAKGWASAADPDLDVGFVVLRPYHGRTIQQVLGADTMTFDPGYRNLVRVTGYPASKDRPITCRNWTTRQSGTQLRFDCDGFTGGTSGSPWITGFNARTGTGRIVGVLGGYQQGGNTADISYSAYLGNAIRQLYRQAVA
jgi:V8-like Glu-specific endopeptidase